MRTLLPFLSFMFVVIAQAQDWKPAKVALTTKWGKEVTPANVWQQYPRPQMQRTTWMNLNGMWDYAVLTKGQSAPAKFDGQILVPFCLESSLSGVGKPLLPTQELWYTKKFTVPATWAGKDVVLHFDAVDWETKLWVNGKKVGEHKGGSDPFSFNITPYLKNGEQQIVMSVWDPTDTDLQARGKQVLDPRGIWYTAVSGIWQTVWLEPLNKTSVQQFVPVPDIDNGKISFTTTASSITGKEQLHFVIKHQGKVIKDTVAAFANNISVTIPSAKLWTPEHPNIYTVDVELRSRDRVTDQFNTYFAMRKISLGSDKNGYTRLMLNNKPVFQYGTLDQGWWPDGLLTPPSDEAMLFDMVKLKEMGFNMLRKHIKVEPSRYYYHADTMGLLLWQDMPSGFAGTGPSHVAADAKEDWVRPAESAKQFEAEWKAIMDHLKFFPSIVMWVPLNEGWGQYDTKRLAAWTKSYDPTRLVDAPSGWTDRGVGDVNDAHQYPGPGMEPPSANKGRAIVLGEFGGLGLVVKDHIWNPNKRNWGYKTYLENQTLTSEYTQLMYNMELMVPRGLAAAIYTQTTDVEGEVNGLITYDREVVKIPEEMLRILHAPLYRELAGKITFINKQSETDANKFKSTQGKVSNDWLNTSAPENFTETSEPVALKTGASVYSYQDFNIADMPSGLGLKLLGFGDAKVYLNGKLVWQEDKIRTKRHYDDINLSNNIKYLMPGNNRIAIECTNATQDMKFDFALYRLDN
ncbi:MAG: sugar-binding domain-containing protein [Segetibacter sp.]